jgi:hypothetical protein
VRAVDLRATHRLVTELVERELRREGLPPATFGNLRSQELILAKTADRSVLGCMNDMAFLCEVAISDAGGLAHFDLGELNHALHRNINSSRGYLGGQPVVHRQERHARHRDVQGQQRVVGIQAPRHHPAAVSVDHRGAGDGPAPGIPAQADRGAVGGGGIGDGRHVRGGGEEAGQVRLTGASA